MRWLTAIPIYNEAKNVRRVLDEIQPQVQDLVLIDDGSTDDTPTILKSIPDLKVVTHPKNRGYGAAIRSAFCYAIRNNYDVLVTMDCDGQHEPSRIPVLLEALSESTDIVSGSRYLRDFRQDTLAPTDRRFINHTITNELNEAYSLNLTDAFCGFKAYRVSSIQSLRLTEEGWGMPLQLWVQAAHLQMKITEIGVPRIYLDPNRAFGGVMNDPETRLSYYRDVIRLSDQECRNGRLGFGSLSPILESCL
jgi:glycosyltransferase involved in cell wall biosynthesis